MWNFPDGEKGPRNRNGGGNKGQVVLGEKKRHREEGILNTEDWGGKGYNPRCAQGKKATKTPKKRCCKRGEWAQALQPLGDYRRKGFSMLRSSSIRAVMGAGGITGKGPIMQRGTGYVKEQREGDQTVA